MADLETLCREGIRAFDSGEYYESHEFFEEAYNEADSAEDQFFRALLELAGAFHILVARRRRRGALEKISRAVSRLGPFLPEHRGIDVRGLVERLAEWQRALAAGPGNDPPPPLLGGVSEP